MENKSAPPARADLGFFSRMTADNSHEIKNALAIINENAGLLQDLVAMADQGRPLDPDRLRRLAAKIREQVARADHLAKSSHRLAHSIDRNQSPADVVQVLNLMATLVERPAARAQVHLDIEPEARAVYLPVSAFDLLHLLWRIIAWTLGTVPPGGTIGITLDKSEESVALRAALSSLAAESGGVELTMPNDVCELAEGLGGEIAVDRSGAAFVLTFNKKAEQGE